MKPSVARALVLAVLAVVSGLTACRRPGLPGSGVIVREERGAAAVGQVRIRGGYLDVAIRAGTAPSLTVEGDDNLLPFIETETLGDRLTIGWAAGSYDPTRPIRIEVGLPALRELEIAGAVRLAAAGVEGERLEVEVAGACEVSLAGRVDALAVQASGACSLSAFELVAREAVVDLAGVGSADVHVTDDLEASVAGVGKIRYRGEPRVRQEVSGLGRVSAE